MFVGINLLLERGSGRAVPFVFIATLFIPLRRRSALERFLLAYLRLKVHSVLGMPFNSQIDALSFGYVFHCSKHLFGQGRFQV